MPKFIDRTGQRFGRLTAIEYLGSAKWLCRCDCGQMKVVATRHLVSGKTKSCGCFRREFSKNKATTHNGSKTRLYVIWRNMIARCSKTYHSEYVRYGAKGIKVCKEWQDFSVFREWAISNGYEDNLSIDRINPNGNYEPSNCRWADEITQANNKRNNVILEYQGKRYTMAELARKSGLKLGTLWARLHNGWSVEEAVERPLREWGTPQAGM